jgi:transposase
MEGNGENKRWQTWALLGSRPTQVRGREFAPTAAREALELIGELYAVEADCSPEDDRARSRADRSRDIVRRIRDRALKQEALPRSPLRKAMKYMTLSGRACSVLEDSGLPLDDNASERAPRGVVVGRKNHYGAGSERGREMAAILYSLIESARVRQRGTGCLPARRRSSRGPR